jgi:gliding-associated putative ABC transporter substrate-binding component GldG
MNRRSSKILYSTMGISALFLIFAALNFIVSKLNVRGDLTEEKLYTVSDSTRKVLKKLDTPVTLKFYYTKSSNMPAFLKNYASRVLDLMREYKQVGGNNITIEKYDPAPDSDAEDSAVMDGITGQQLNTGDKIYLGLAVQVLDQTVSLPFLSPEREQLLEYDMTRAIAQASKTNKSTIGVMSALPVMGQKPNGAMMQAGNFNSIPSWMVFKELKNDYQVREIPLKSEVIDTGIDLLIIVHPAGITDKTQFAIDQYILKGGKVLAFLDPVSFYTSATSKNNRGAPPMLSSNLDKLLKAWGISYNPEMVVSDMTYGRRMVSPEKRITFPTVLDILPEGLNKEEVFTSQLTGITEVFAGAFSGNPTGDIKETILAVTTLDSHLLASSMATNPDMAVKEFKPDNKKYTLAVRLSGKFKTAFPEGSPDMKPDNKAEPEKESLKESQKESTVILVGDSDMLYDELCVKVTSILGQTIVTPLNDNMTFFQNMTGYLTGDSDLIGIRSRKVIGRPFTVVKKIQSQAEQKYKNKIVELENDLIKAQELLGKLQAQKAKDQKLIISPEQKEEIKNYRQKESNVKKELKTVRKELRGDIDSLQNRLKWINIALIPLIVILFGLGFAIYKKGRRLK